jgi:hypothetical protein
MPVRLLVLIFYITLYLARSVATSRPVFTNVSAPTQDDLLGMALDENSASSEPTDLRSVLT